MMHCNFNAFIMSNNYIISLTDSSRKTTANCIIFMMLLFLLVCECLNSAKIYTHKLPKLMYGGSSNH